MRSLYRWWARVGSAGDFMRRNVVRGLRAWHVLAFVLGAGMEKRLSSLVLLPSPVVPCTSSLDRI